MARIQKNHRFGFDEATYNMAMKQPGVGYCQLCPDYRATGDMKEIIEAFKAHKKAKHGKGGARK